MNSAATTTLQKKSVSSASWDAWNFGRFSKGKVLLKHFPLLNQKLRGEYEEFNSKRQQFFQR